MTWKEKRELEIQEDIREKDKEDREKKARRLHKRKSNSRNSRRKGSSSRRPQAPRETTQDRMELHNINNSMEIDDLDFDGEKLDNMGSMGCDDGKASGAASNDNVDGRRHTSSQDSDLCVAALAADVKEKFAAMRKLLVEKDLLIEDLRSQIKELGHKNRGDSTTDQGECATPGVDEPACR
eukprot:g4867.t1